MTSHANPRHPSASSHKRVDTSTSRDASFVLRPSNPQPMSSFPAVAFSPAPQRPPRSAFKRMLARMVRKLKKYLDKKAEKYTSEQPSEPSSSSGAGPGSRRGNGRRSPQHTGWHSTRQNHTPRSPNSPSPPPTRARPGAQPRSLSASTSSTDAKGPFSTLQKQALTRKLTTIRESSTEKLGASSTSGSSRASRARRSSTVSFTEADAASSRLHNVPTTPIPERATYREHFPNLTCRRCKVDWARADALALNDFVLHQNTEAMRSVSREAAAVLRSEMGWIRRRDSFDDSAWHEGSIRHVISAFIHANRWHRHHRTTSGQSIPSLSYSHSTPGSVAESFPTPAQPPRSLDEAHSVEPRHSRKQSNKKDSPTMTPAITVSVWDEDPNSPPLSSSGFTPITTSDDPPRSPDRLRPPKSLARLRGKQPWYLTMHPTSPSPSVPPVPSLSVPSEPIDFSMESSIEPSHSQPPLIYT
ncbi:hypothetical protein M408DRAFT_28656 [Serendipita vermifera MAFF 305830]|uniref:Uncharacterized protein n=1 Tax=Serendipita vermifera MAFF 305830 TaxID=933852 RepID=A0A0C3AR50_SERVB|nr:hypothetical protein M408DRAFT_28656 [Serendipita vermifera MAFF 305830]